MVGAVAIENSEQVAVIVVVVVAMPVCVSDSGPRVGAHI